MGNPARKMSKSKRDSRRAQTYKLSAPTIVECPQCHEMTVPHRICKSCGSYDGKVIVSTDAE
ncbi:MAG: 50S ribosomal protein L32 [Sarcina sp.]